MGEHGEKRVLDYYRPSPTQRRAELLSTASVTIGAASVIGAIALWCGWGAGGHDLIQLFLVPLGLGVWAIVLSVVAGTKVGSTCDGVRRRNVWGWLLGVLGIATALFVAVLPPLCRSSGSGNRTRCGSHLRSIGQMIQMYAHDNGGALPSRLDLLITEMELSPDMFICPSSNDQKAEGPTTQQLLADFALPGRCSYTYHGAGLTKATATPDTVVACEPLSNHANDGMNVLYGDTHVDSVSATEAKHILNELKLGFNPPRPMGQATAGPATRMTQ